MQRLTEFHDSLDLTIEAVWADGDYLGALAKGADELVAKAQSVGDTAAQNLAEVIASGSRAEANLLIDYFIHFEWAEQVKNFLLLWRDVIFEHQKAELLLLDNKTDKEAIKELKTKSHEAVQSATELLKKFLDNKLTEIRTRRNGEKKQLEEWRLQANPWLKYRAQIGEISEQCAELERRFHTLKDTSKTLRNIRGLINETVIFCETESKSFVETAKQIEEFIKTNQADSAKVAKRLESTEADLKMTSYASGFTHALDGAVSDLVEKMQVPVSVSGGTIRQREVAFRRRCRQWLESEVLPVLYDVWELTERTGNSLKMSLVNIRNKSILLSKNENEATSENTDLCHPIYAFLKNAKDNELELVKEKILISGRLEEQFELSKIFEPEEFLPVPLQSTIEQMRLDQSPLMVRLREWADLVSNRLQEARSDVVQESALSLSEKVVRFVQEHSPDPDNNQYSNIFLTKGYIGESFVVGREDEMAHVRKIVNNWRLGFRGAVILSGKRFSGKSLFGELVANRHFIGHTVRLSPNEPLQVGGRRMTATTDLGEALNFIEKHTLGERQLIWLDDLELWADSNLPLSQNVRRLCRSIDSLSDRLFFMVSMSNWARKHLDRFHDMTEVFQAEISMDRMSAAEIRQAILIRHGATHRTLVDEEGKEITPQQFQKMTERIYKSSRGNIGDALNQWSASTFRMDEEKVTHLPMPGNALPNFLRPDSSILLRTLLLTKRTNEYQLRRFFGPAFKEKYGGILQRLIRTGLLTRQIDGWLELNEVAANEVGRLVFEE